MLRVAVNVLQRQQCLHASPVGPNIQRAVLLMVLKHASLAGRTGGLSDKKTSSHSRPQRWEAVRMLLDLVRVRKVVAFICD